MKVDYKLDEEAKSIIINRNEGGGGVRTSDDGGGDDDDVLCSYKCLIVVEYIYIHIHT